MKNAKKSHQLMVRGFLLKFQRSSQCDSEIHSRSKVNEVGPVKHGTILANSHSKPGYTALLCTISLGDPDYL